MTHFRSVAGASELPIMIYNNPVSYGVDLTPEMLADLADEPKLVCVKESSDNVRRITDLKILCRDRFALFCGVD
ncbi:MAG TPA: dihydrodipicolinate synthase family protein, partial [Pseudomonadales bacterium]|nr:dihydrodipicolinate synthase family protein [Pseudomonadales bacterium]